MVIGSLWSPRSSKPTDFAYQAPHQPIFCRAKTYETNRLSGDQATILPDQVEALHGREEGAERGKEQRGRPDVRLTRRGRTARLSGQGEAQHGSSERNAL